MSVYAIGAGVGACVISEVINRRVVSKKFETPCSAVAILAGSILYWKGYVAKYPWIGSFCLQAATPLALKGVNIVTPKGNCIWNKKSNRWEVSFPRQYGKFSVELSIFYDETKNQWQSLTLTEFEDYTIDPLYQMRVRQVCRAIFSGIALGLPLLA